METPVKRWRRRCGEGWIGGADAGALCDAYAAFQDERDRHAGPVRIQLVDPNPINQLAGLFAALGDDDPVDVFVTPGHGLPAEMEAYEAAVAGDFFWSGRELVSCGRLRKTEQSAQVSRVMIATGGTTAGPRFAVHTWATLERAVHGLQTWLGGGPVDSVCVLPLHHVSGLMQAVRSYVSGGVLTVWEWPRLVAGDFPMLQAKPGVLSLVPTQLARLLDVPGGLEWMQSFRCIFMGGAAMWPGLRERARAASLPLAPCYGMTETAAQVATLRPEEFLAGVDGVGAALPHAAIEIVDESGVVVAHDTEGRIRVRAGSLFHGYFPQAGAESIPVFDTNDRGVLDAAGRLTVLGRIDAIINTGGEKVDPFDVEEAIRALGASDVAVLGMPDPHWGELVVALVVDCPHDDDALHVLLRKTLAAHKVPKRFIRVQSLPRSEAGKLDRRALRELCMGQGNHE
ncbi:MAG: AMP-binding protein [Opitutaceae bacterium]|nr:AMP-binding protein [Opitutaceae bacterium]